MGWRKKMALPDTKPRSAFKWPPAPAMAMFSTLWLSRPTSTLMAPGLCQEQMESLSIPTKWVFSNNRTYLFPSRWSWHANTVCSCGVEAELHVYVSTTTRSAVNGCLPGRGLSWGRHRSKAVLMRIPSIKAADYWCTDSTTELLFLMADNW